MTNKILSIGNFALSNLIVNGVDKGKYFDGIGYRFVLICSYYQTKCYFITAIGKEKEWQFVLKTFKKNNCIPASIYQSDRSVSFYWNYDKDILNITLKNLDLMSKMTSLLKTEHLVGVSLLNLCALGLLNEEKVVFMANKQNCPVSFIFHNSDLLDALPKDYFELIKKVKYFFLNEEEATQLTKENNIDFAGVKLHSYCPNVFVTRGAKGVSWFHNKKQIDYPAIKTNVVDTSGAGDVFASTVINGYNLGLNPEQSIRMGLTMASISVGGYFTDSIYNAIC